MDAVLFPIASRVADLSRFETETREQVTREVAAIDELVSRVATEAAQHLQHTQSMLTRASNTNRPPIARAAAEQRQHAAAWGATLGKVCSEFQQLGEAGARHCADIVDAGSGMSSLARSSRRVALNAAIRALSCGDQGAAITVIASHMRELSDQVEAATQLIGGLAVELQGAIDEVCDTATRIEALAVQFTADVESQTRDLQGDVGTLSGTLATAVGQGEQGLRDLLDASESVKQELELERDLRRQLDSIAGSLRRVLDA